MQQPSVYFVGRPGEVAHHAAPFRKALEVRIAEPVEVLSQANPGDLAIFFSEHFDRFRDCCMNLRRRNVATVYLIDGILEWRNAWENTSDEVACPFAMRPVLSHKAACIGNSQARVLKSWGNVGKTEVVGIPRLDQFGQIQSNRTPDDPEFRVLVMSAKTPGFTQKQIQITRNSLLELKHWCRKNSSLTRRLPGSETLETRQVEFIWRLTNNFANEIGVENRLSDLTGEELANVLPTVDAVISTPSTAMLEAMRMGIPTAILDFHNCPHYVPAGWRIHSAEHIPDSLQQMFETNQTKLMYQNDQLTDALYVEGSASERMVELVRRMLKVAAKQISDGQADRDDSLVFPPQMLTPSTTDTGIFDHQQAYENSPEFLIHDKTVLQVELAHARREISHLHRELTQLRSELNEAHQIFELIEKHPIAGPVVRIRQKMLDLMAAIRKRKNELDSACPVSDTNHGDSQAESR